MWLFVFCSSETLIFSFIPLTALGALFLIAWNLPLMPTVVPTLAITMVQARCSMVYNWLFMSTDEHGFQLVQVRSAHDKAGKLFATLQADRLVAKDGTLRSAPAACPCKSTSARSKKLTKTNSFEALTVEDSDGNDTNFIVDESGSEESDGDSNISIISNGEVCFAAS